MRSKISALWVFVMFNIVVADILSFTDAAFLKQVMTGYAGEVQITHGFLLIAAVVLEISIAMVFLSRVLPYRANRRINIAAVLITTAFVVGGGATTPHYIFLAVMEIVAMILIVRYVWKWPKLEANSSVM